jgi:hypothetical protein
MRVSRREFLAACAAQVHVRAGCPDAGSLIDLGSACLLPESLAGFRSVMAGSKIPRGVGLIIPGAGTLSERMAGTVRQRLRSGGSVLLESAVGLTRQRIASPYVPYVDFTWPVRARIREFYPLPLDPRKGDRVIATFAQRPVALRRGRLILLGSPVGSALLAGDPDAHRWVASVLRWMLTSASGDGRCRI